jgi:hypothetical protein
MKKNNLTQILSAALALGMSGAAMAAPQFYGAITYGESDTNGDDTINYALFDSANTGDFSPLGTGYGNSELASLKLGLRFGKNMFVELGSARTQFDGAASGGNGGTNDCNLSPSAGLIEDCFDDAAIAFDSEVKSIDLVFGWNFAPGEGWTLQPYVGLRQIEVEDNRQIDYLYNQLTDGFNDFIVDNSRFKKTGFVVGVRSEKNFGQFFFSGDFVYSYASGSRNRTIVDTEYSFDDEDEESSAVLLRTLGSKSIPPDAPITDIATLTTRDDISVTQWKARVAVGRRFKITGNNNLNMSIGYNLGSVNGFDTRDTNTSVEASGFTQGSLGDANARLKSRGFDMTIGWNF